MSITLHANGDTLLKRHIHILSQFAKILLVVSVRLQTGMVSGGFVRRVGLDIVDFERAANFCLCDRLLLVLLWYISGDCDQVIFHFVGKG